MSLVARLRDAAVRQRSSRNPLLRYGANAVGVAWRAARRVHRLATNPDERALAWLRTFRRHVVHQTTTVTWLDRYPDIFSRCAACLDGRGQVNLLSYGCSTGEEVVTLRHYFPHARLTGAEINPVSLAACRRLVVDGDVSFVRSTREAIARRGPFDAIFCMAVLQRTPHAVEAQGLPSLRDLYPFERFDRQVSELDALLRPGGLLVIHHTQYRFPDATVASGYVALDPPVDVPATVPYYDRDSRRVSGPVRVSSVFVKQGPNEAAARRAGDSAPSPGGRRAPPA